MRKHAFLYLIVMQAGCGLSTPSSDPSNAASVAATGVTRAPAPAAGTQAAGAGAASATVSNDAPAAQQAHYVGRFSEDATTHTLRFAWEGSAAMVAFNGTGIQARMGDANLVYDGNAPMHNVFDVTIDGNWQQALTLSPNIATLDLATGLAEGAHTLSLTKRTEGMVGPVVLEGFVPVNGNLMTPPSAASLSMAFYGVSNEAGYGDLAAVTAADMCEFSSATENAEMAYAALAAHALGAELTNISYSGKGIINNGYPLYDPRPLPSLYNLIDPANPNLTVDFSGPEPDVVGVDLGGNDFTGGTPDGDTFEQAYTQFLATLRERYPHAPIVCVMGPMMTGDDRTNMSTWINASIQARSAAGDDNITFLPFDVYTGTVYGCSYHPSAALQASMATVFEAHVRTVAPAFGASP